MGFRSGRHADQWIHLIRTWSGYLPAYLAACDLGLSCIQMLWSAIISMKGIIRAFSELSEYHYVKRPTLCACEVIPAQTTTDPPPNESLSSIQTGQRTTQFDDIAHSNLLKLISQQNRRCYVPHTCDHQKSIISLIGEPFSPGSGLFGHKARI